ncbi:hypothetical protein PISL3812_07582 [Talaromyces islandicus]|uniref:Steroid 5-alpha reductase C-terminal domain-containing protein n=1 Tax=Talaromyces islandicus TaxID=28573 RepID=A0A0U1M4K7_TALIS|nr:hypothetical protein PISL3812_07582 [Talaromyces islandicus]
MAEKKLHDNVSRNKAPSVLGRTVFVGLRALDTFWQYHLLSRGWSTQLIERLNGRTVQHSQIFWSSGALVSQPYYGVVLALSLLSSIKQIIAMLLVSEQETPVGSAVMVATFNTVINTVNTLLSVWVTTCPASTSHNFSLVLNNTIVLGLAAYAIGILTEMISELQRRAFKRNPANKGYATVTGGIVWGAFTCSFFFYDFATRGVPIMEEYLVYRYGEAYKRIQKKVKYSLIPGIF